jgi:hypothetical protein
MCEAEDEATQQAAAGACATLASVPEIAAVMLSEPYLAGTMEKARTCTQACTRAVHRRAHRGATPRGEARLLTARLLALPPPAAAACR